MNGLKLFALLYLFAVSGAACAQATVLQCSAKLDGVPHSLKLFFADGNVTGFDYSSTNPKYGEDCEVEAHEGQDGRTTASVWKRSPGGVLVSVFDPPADSKQHAYQADVKIEQFDRGYRLTILSEPEPKICALHGYIAPVVVIAPTKSRCKLQE